MKIKLYQWQRDLITLSISFWILVIVLIFVLCGTFCRGKYIMPELDEKNVLQFGQSSSNRVYQLQKELDNTKAKLRAANRLIYQLYEWRNQRTKIFKASTKDSVWKYVEEWVGNATNRKVVREKP